MIEKLKKNIAREGFTLKGIVAMLIFGAIAMVFVFFGLPSKNSHMGVGAAARVNNSLISVSDVRGETQRLEQIYGPMAGAAFSGDAMRQYLRGQAVDNLISMELITQAAQNEGILATDAEVREFIVKEIPAFQKEGRFQRELYQGYLDYSKTVASEFEDKIRKDRKTQRTRRLFEVSSKPLALELEKMKQLKGQKINVQFAKIEKDAWISKHGATDSEVKAKLKDADFNKKMEEYFKANIGEFKRDAETHAAHILIKSQAGNKESEEKALAKINEIKKRAEKEDFAKLAKEFSEDRGSKDSGGDLGFFSKGKMVPEFQDAAEQQKIGVVGEPVKSTYGYHLIKVIEKRAAQEPSLEKNKEEIATKVLNEDRFETSIKALESALAKKESNEVEIALKGLGASWEETGFFDLGQDTVPKLTSQVVSQAAFSLTEKAPLSTHLIRDGGVKYVLKWKAGKQEGAVSDDKSIMAEIARENSYERFSQWVEVTKKSAKIEKNVEAIQGR
jgi:peptidyl-prolyl cis-trans isomerase D